MKISGTSPVARTRTVERVTRRRGAEGTAPAARPAVQDVASVMDIPEAEFTPKVRAAITRLMAEVERLRQELEMTRRKVAYFEELADEDALVPVLNRRAFVRELSRIMSFVERYGTPHSVLFFDLDGLKGINDTYGHAAGDEALRHAARILTDSVRESDIVGRLGGDEFGVILVQADQKTANEKAAHLAERIRSEPLSWQGREIHLSVAYGAHTMQGGDDPSSALHAADRAMYARKRQNGR